MKTIKKILVLGSSFGGATAALELKRKLTGSVQVTVVSPSADFTYLPSLIWVPFGRRKLNDITVPIRSVMEKKGIAFIHDSVTRVTPEENMVMTRHHGPFPYDYLVISTGMQMDFTVVENLNPGAGYVDNIMLPKYSERTSARFNDLVKNPGPMVVGATQGASFVGAAYEYLFNADKELRRRGVRDKVELTWFTPEPFLGHFGIEGIQGGQAMLKALMKVRNIKWYTNASVDAIGKEKITLKDGTVIPYKMAMVMPPFTGTDLMKHTPQLVGPKGFVVCNEGFQQVTWKNIYAVGLAVEVKTPFSTTIPFGVPKTGYATEVSAKIAVHNIVAEVQGRDDFKKMKWVAMPAVWIMDAGHKEMIMLGNQLLKPRRWAIIIPNIFNDWLKVIVEKYILWKFRHGYSALP